MSIVIYKDGMVSGDSIVLFGVGQARSPKVFPYRTTKNETGVIGYVGNPATGQNLIRAYLDGGVCGFKKENEHLVEVLPENGAAILIAPSHGHYLLTAGWFEPLCRMPLQAMAIGYDEGVSLAQMMFWDPDRDWTTDQIVERIIAMQTHSAACYVREPIVSWKTKDLTHDKLDELMADPINGQFICHRPVEGSRK